jgi:hypothetical protein
VVENLLKEKQKTPKFIGEPKYSSIGMPIRFNLSLFQDIIIIKISKFEDKESILKAATEKN